MKGHTLHGFGIRDLYARKSAVTICIQGMSLAYLLSFAPDVNE